MINGAPTAILEEVLATDIIELNGNILKEAEEFLYIAYYKPRGVECTLNRKIPGNLADTLQLSSRVFPVGRLDKESEGLLLLTNDGKLYNKISHNKQFQEKEYIVTVDKPLTDEAISSMSSGMTILGKETRPAKIQRTNDYTFNIILTQGMNRQIRRMCYKTGFEVTSLKRIRIINIQLGDLHPGEWIKLSPSDFEL